MRLGAGIRAVAGMLAVWLAAAAAVAAPTAAEQWVEQGLAKFARQDYRGALADYDRALDQDPGLVRAYGHRGNARAALSDLQGALTDYSTVIRLKPTSALAWASRGAVRASLGDRAGATTDLRRAAELYRAQGNSEGLQAANEALRRLAAAPAPGPRRTVASRTASTEFAIPPLPVGARPRIVALGLTFGGRLYAIGQDGEGPMVSGWYTREAKKSGLHRGDLLVSVDGRPIRSVDDLGRVVRGRRPGETVRVGIRRAGEPMELPVLLSDSLVALPDLEPEAVPTALTRLTPLAATAESRAEQAFGWGNVRAVETAGDELRLIVGPATDSDELRRGAARLAAGLGDLNLARLVVRTDTPDPARAWQATAAAGRTAPTVQPLPPEPPAPVAIEAGTLLAVQLDTRVATALEGGEDMYVSGKLLYPVRDRAGVPLLPAGTVVRGRLLPASPFGHRFVADRLGTAPLTASSGVLPSRETLQQTGFGFLGPNIGSVHRTTLLPAQVVGVRLEEPLRVNPDDREEAGFPLRPVNRVLPPVPADGKAALALYNRGTRAAAAGDWAAAAALWQGALARTPSQEARAALGRAYEELGRLALAVNQPLEAIAWLELAQPLRSEAANTRALLACAYARLLDPNRDAPPGATLAYLRRRAGSLGLDLREYLGNGSLLFAEGTPNPARGDYFDNVIGNGVIRFGHQPIRIYLGAAPAPEFEQATWEAARRWEALSQGTVRFERADRPDGADIVVFFTALRAGPEAGRAELTTLGDRFPALLVNLNLWPTFTVRPADAPRVVQSIAAHEIGHALGLWGHSDDIEDIMYPESGAAYEPSVRDIRTLMRLYRSPAKASR